MAKLIMLRGIPASGKTTWAEKYLKTHLKTVRISKDCLREMLSFNNFSFRYERKIVKIEKEIAREFLQSDYDVIIDDTNLLKAYEDQWRQVAEESISEFKIIDFEISLKEAIERDKKRKNPVGHVAIRFLNIVHQRRNKS